MKFIFAAVALIISTSLFAQINVADSSVQVIGYWSKNDKQSYNVISTKYKVSNGDTSSRQVISYGVDVVVTDSTEKSYTVEWQYKTVNVEGADKFTNAIAGLSSNTKVVIQTDEMGSFSQVLNIAEIQALMKKALDKIRVDFKSVPNIKKITEDVAKSMTTREAIETQGIRDILQFYTFHGAKYTLGEEYKKTLVSNGVPSVPVDVDMTVQLTEINTEDDNSVVRVWKEFDVKQMTDATYHIIKGIAGTALKREDMPDVVYEESTFSRVHGSSGWIIYSIQTRQTITGDTVEIEQVEIEVL